MNTSVSQFPGKLIALFVGMYGVHVYGQIILFESKGFLLSTFVILWLIIIVSFVMNSTLNQVIAISYRSWHKNFILFFICYLILSALFYDGYPFLFTFITLTSTILPGFFFGVISNIEYRNFMIMNGWLKKLKTVGMAKRIYKVISVLIILFMFYQTYLFYVNKLGLTLVLTTVNNEYYQDLGDYFIIFYCGWLGVRENNRVRQHRDDRSYFGFTLVIVIEIAVFVLFLQLIGSNKAPLTLVAICLSYLFFSSEGFMTYRLRQMGAILLISTIGLSAFFSYVNPEIISSLRYFNEAEMNGFANNSSITSRWDQFANNGIEQVNRNWILGDLSIEHYIHSSLVTIQTHTGLIGTLLFWTFILMRVYYIYFVSKDILAKSITAPIIFVSIISSAFWWLPLWFLIGFVYMHKPLPVLYGVERKF